jgi:hypothetical protein
MVNSASEGAASEGAETGSFGRLLTLLLDPAVSRCFSWPEPHCVWLGPGLSSFLLEAPDGFSKSSTIFCRSACSASTNLGLDRAEKKPTAIAISSYGTSLILITSLSTLHLVFQNRS